MFYQAQKRTNYWSKIRKKAPKVPDITCPAIDEVITKIEKLVDRNISKTQFKAIERKMEKIEKEMRQAEMHVQKVRLAHTPQRDQLPQLGRNRSRELVDGESGRERLPWALFTWV